MNRSTRILIIGGGIAGLTLATALRRLDFRPDLIERAAEWAPVGAGITLGINAMQVLARLGLKDATLEHSRVMEKAQITDQSGRVLARTDLGVLARKHGPSVAIHRADLHSVLLGGAEGTNLRLGVEPKAIEQEGHAIRVEFSDGSAGDYDLVMGADGIRSATRRLVFGQSPIYYSGYTCWRFMAPNPGGVTTTTEMWGRGRRFGIVPMKGDQIYCFATMNAEGGQPDPTGGRFIEFRKLFADFEGDAAAILHAAPEETRLIHTDLEEVRLDRWERGGVVLIGDAAHAMTPNMGQGAAMAIEDAWVLARCLDRPADRDAVTTSFHHRRFPRADAVRRQSWNLGRIAQLERPMACTVRNNLMRLMPERVSLSQLERLLTAKI